MNRRPQNSKESQTSEWPTFVGNAVHSEDQGVRKCGNNHE